MILYLQNSNIIQLFSMLKKDDPAQQMVYYQVGRLTPRGAWRGYNLALLCARPE